MPLPFNLQKLLPEALDLLRYMGTHDRPQTAEALENGSRIGTRLIGKAIRRLVNYDYIHMNLATGEYELTSDGRIAVQQIAAHDASPDARSSANASTPQILRHLTVVLPRLVPVGRATDLYFGVNNPDQGDELLPGTAQVELKVTVTEGTLSLRNLSLSVPPTKASEPTKLALTVTEPGKTVRVRVDAFQAFEFDSMELLGGMYFDVRVAPDSTPRDSDRRAVGMDLVLRPPR